MLKGLPLYICRTVLVIFFFHSLAASGQSDLSMYIDPVHGYTRDDLIKLALERNLDFLAIKQRSAEAQGFLNQAGLRPNPDFSISITDGAILNSSGEREYSLSYTQKLELGGKRDHRVEVADLALEIARYEIANRQRELVAETKTAYVEALAGIRNLKVLQQTYALIQKTHEITIQRVKEGESPSVEQGLTEAELGRLKANVALAASEVESLILELKTLAGMPPEEPLFLKGEDDIQGPTVDVAELLQKALTNRPDLLSAKVQEESAGAEIALAKAEGISDVNAFAGYANSSSRFDQFGLNESGALVPVSDRDNTISAGVSIQLPFFSRNQGNIQAATARKQAAILKTRALQRFIEQEVRSAVHRYNAAKEAVRILKTIVVPQSEKNLEVIRASYELGEVRFLDLIQEQRRALEIHNSYTEVWKVYALSLIQLENKTGVQLAGKEE